MEISDKIGKMLERLGEDVTVVVNSNRTKCKAVIEPMRYKNKLYMDIGSTVMGLNDTECFLYIGPADPDFTGKELSTAIFSADRAYNVSRADRISMGGTCLYIWAVLTPRIKEGSYDVL